MKFLRLLLIFSIAISSVIAQNKDEAKEGKKEKDKLNSGTFSGLKFRGIGPAFTSGRIADFAVNPNNHSEYYVATASGGVWKTINNGTTWQALADTVQAYSMGVVVIDPTNSNIVWLGTGENNHQRALGYGCGVYKSSDGGQTWKFMGLKESRQIGGIVVDPKNPNTVYVAAEGSVWGPGGDRGLYKTIDGGKTWSKVLNISENTGVNNVVMDPRDPNVLYATSEQRRRHIYTKIGGGPETAVYKSTDAGTTWEKIMNGLPKSDMGGTGIAISPANPDVVYIIVEAAEGGGFYRSENRGASWQKMSDHFAQGQYYNEIYCDPKNVDKVFSVETVTQYTEDGGKTWKPFGNNDRHVDDHALWIDPTSTDHIMIGGDGGVYETFDMGKNFIYKSNLPVTQFYRVNTDNDLPFYNIYAGTQDNNSFGGPSRSIRGIGVISDDWVVTNGGDGFWTAIDPKNPDIVYAESQYGGMVRFDRKSGEAIDIRPEPAEGEKTFKWYWDTPLILSPHSNTRLYTAAEKVFRSDDRGDSWTEISDDLTTKTDRNTFPVMGKYWSIDADGKDVSTSQFGLIVSLVESAKKENLLYAGTDDGLIQVTEDAKTWHKISDFPGVPTYTLVSDICPSRFDENVVYASFNNHKRDDFKPYLIKSEDKGKTWKSIASNLPANGAVNTIVEDPVNPKLLFVGTEWGVFFTIDSGEKWIQLKAGIPLVKIPDITIQEREKDLVVATFGRGFYVLDDYSPLRTVSKELFEKDAYIFPVKDALMYIPSGGHSAQGSTYFRAPNPDYGATFTYYIKDVAKTMKAERKEKEKPLFKDGKPIPQPSLEVLHEEELEIAPYLIFKITDDAGNVVRKITKSASAGINRVNWDLRYEGTSPVTTEKFEPVAATGAGGRRGGGFGGGGILSMPGKYKVSLYLVAKGQEKELVPPTEFNVVPLNNTTLPAKDRGELVAFQKKAAELARTAYGAQHVAEDLVKRTEAIKQALNNTPSASFALFNRAMDISKNLDNILIAIRGREGRGASAEENPPAPVTLSSRLQTMLFTSMRTTTNLTQNQEVAYKTLHDEIQPIIEQLKKISEVDLKALETEMEKINVPWTPGRMPELKK
ncbi:MAG: glycosyl hydrolase [Ignavibacteriales bacterium]|nr:glycosyl hydrolase [Ignavibacteriales bacterium]